MTAEPPQRYEIRFQPDARRAIAQRLPEAVAERLGAGTDLRLSGSG